MKLLITIDGKNYEVEVKVLEDDAPREESLPSRLVNSAALAGTPTQNYDGAWNEAGTVCRSPLTGLVIKLFAAPGQKVKAGDLLIVLEAMKMETNVTAPRDGVIRHVSVAQRDSVKFHQVLLELE